MDKKTELVWTIKTDAGTFEIGCSVLWIEFYGHSGVSAQQVLLEAIQSWFAKGEDR